ncbi:hypothetical protein K4L06_14430 [Lysobacter sp. BMK333-48F3]|uniref:RHS repeat-associated core domain-containing protein n=1 Tax=Lysobacter sp. BMK333-48F3 TaxID=2867962 RepID=UPI001C8B811F|nr:RHS repeat-associated core domain-containing protein [Lysobacter sp. BMK333-48F3]MBX9402506.1 hypothetical protein [Lysobacter sp. BMK333-48F3]
MKWISMFACSTLLIASPSVKAQTVVEYIHTDALGSPVAVTDAGQNTIERSEYEPYGQLLNRPAADGPGYTGHVVDTQTGLSYMQQRYYDAELGRFLSVDPVAASGREGGNFNRYRYADGNPYKFIDPDGRAACPTGTRVCYQSIKSETGTAQQPGPNARTQAKDAQAVQAHKAGRLSDGTKLNVNKKTTEEQGIKVGADGTSSNPFQKICWSCSDGDSGTGGRYNVAGLIGDDSAGHTHPGEISEIPGRGDAGLVNVTGQTNYVFSRAGVFAIEKTGVGYRVRQIEGAALRGEARRNLINQIDAWNRSDGASNSGGVSCSSSSC